MPIQPPPTNLEQLGSRRFSFYPAILNIEHNEWIFRQATWSEILVANASTGSEIWIPRRFLGEVSVVDDPVVIVGLLKELEYQGGTVWPHQRQVIQMPIAVNESRHVEAPVSAPRKPAPVIGISLHTNPEVRTGRMVVGAVVVGIVACLVLAGVVRESQVRPRIRFTTHDQSYLELRSDDDFYAVERKLGPSSGEHWRAQTGELQFRALPYPQRGYTVILMGRSRDEARYIGTLDDNGNPVAEVRFANGGNSAALLRSLHKF